MTIPKFRKLHLIISSAVEDRVVETTIRWSVSTMSTYVSWRTSATR